MKYKEHDSLPLEESIIIKSIQPIYQSYATTQIITF